MSDQTNVTPIEEGWRRRAKKRAERRAVVIPLELPSGETVEAYRLPLRYLVKHNEVPDILSASVGEYVALIEGRDSDASAKAMTDKYNEDAEGAFNQWMDVLNFVWLTCVVVPRFTDDSSREDAETEPFWVGDVDYLDKVFLYEWAQGVDQEVITFLHEQESLVGALANGNEVPLSPEPVLRIDRRGGRMVGVLTGQGDLPVGDVHRGGDARDGRKTSTKVEKASNRARGKVLTADDSAVDLRRPDLGVKAALR